jgi:lambda family phage tail tape measure protein
MADLNYDVSVSTTQAETNLTRLQRTVGGLNDTFIRLKTTLATISLGAVISQSIQFADAISDLSDASEIAIGNILGFSKAVEANGGSADGAQKAILRLVNSIGEAADGSASMQQAFRDVGVTIDDLRTASNQDILKKTITGLDQMENSAKRSVLVTQLLGKEFRNVATGQLGAAYADATAKSEKYADAIKKGADAQQNIDKTLGEFKLGLLEAIKPFTELVSKVNIGVENFQRFVQAILAVGAALLTITVAGRVWRVLVLLFDAIVALITSGKNLITFLGELVNGWRAVYAATEGVGGVFARLFVSIKAVGSVIADTLGPAFGILGAAAKPIMLSLIGWWGYVQEGTGAAIDKLREYASALTFGLISPPQSAGDAGRGNASAEMEQRKKDAEAAAQKEKQLREVLDRQAEARQKIALETRQAIDLMAIGLSRQTESIAFETRMIELSKLSNRLSDDQVEIYRAQSDSIVAQLAKLKELEQQQEKLRLQLKFAKDEDKVGLNAQISGLGEQISKTKEYYKVHDENLEYYITKLQTAKKLDAARLQDMENMTKSIEDQISRSQSLGEQLRNINDQKVDLKFETGQVGKGALQKQFDKIQEDARKAGLTAGRAFAESFGQDELTPEKARELADGLALIAKGYSDISAAQTANLEKSREWSTGWADAYNKYYEDANNSATAASQIFNTATKGMEDALVNFAMTGKLSFKDLANSIIADIVRIMVKKVILNALGLGGDMFGGIFKAGGGTVTAGTPYVVGDAGPEMFVPTSAGTIIPNNKLSGGGGDTMVTYNINAVDASSFRSMVARDPQFIYNITEVGRRSTPSRRTA